MNLNPQQQQNRLLQIQESLAKSEIASVLLIDDSESDIELAKERLEAYDLNVVSATNCDAAITLLENNNLSVVFMDWRLVGKSGLEALKLLKLKTPAHIIILTGVATDEDATLALANGASAVMAKPLTDEHIKLIFGTPTKKL